MSNVQQPGNDRTVSFDGREFAHFSVSSGTYRIPVDDETERERLNQLHHILREVCNDRLVFPQEFFPPPDVDEPAVLDCGYGTGAWIDNMIEEYDCVATGIDLYLGEDSEDDDDDDDGDDDDESEVQEFVKKRWNLNERFHMDRSDDRLRPDTFDLINSRLLAEGLDANRWRSYVRDLKQLLKPGGWLQMVELELLFQSNSGLLPANDTGALRQWTEWYDYNMRLNNRDHRVGRKLRNLMVQAGFEHVVGQDVNLHIGDWNPNSASLGRDILENLDTTLETLLLWPCKYHSSGSQPLMSAAAYNQMIDGAKNQIQDGRLKLYYKVLGGRSSTSAGFCTPAVTFEVQAAVGIGTEGPIKGSRSEWFNTGVPCDDLEVKVVRQVLQWREEV